MMSTFTNIIILITRHPQQNYVKFGLQKMHNPKHDILVSTHITVQSTYKLFFKSISQTPYLNP